MRAASGLQGGAALMAPAASSPGTSHGPTETILVVLVDFNDVSMRYSDSQWASTFFSPTAKSISSYYSQISHNTFTFVPANETYGTANDGVVHVHLNYNHPNQGFPQTPPTMMADQQMVRDALVAADPYVNFAAYDKGG